MYKEHVRQVRSVLGADLYHPSPTGFDPSEARMGERSFAREVEHLRLGAGQEFRGEGILAITNALLQSSIGYVGGYQGAPISHLMDVLADAQDILVELGVRFTTSASEAAAMLSASVMHPARGAATFKSTVGTNVASDAPANLSSSGVMGGVLIIIGEDYGEGSSIMQERSHAFAMKSQIWQLDPCPNLERIVKAVEDGFELSEASNTPVMLEVRIRSCHVHGRFTAKDNKRPAFTLAQALESPQRDTYRIVLPPASFAHREKIEKRWPAAVKFIKERKLNEVFVGDLGNIGIILQGGMYNGIVCALQGLGLADVWGTTRLPLYVMNITYPLIDDELVEFCRPKRAVMMVEEGQPDYIEHALHKILRKADVATTVAGFDRTVAELGAGRTDEVPKSSAGKRYQRLEPNLKTRTSRFARVRAEVAAKPEQLVYTTEFMHPRMEEVAGTLPRRLGLWLEARPRLWKVIERVVNRGRRVRTGTIRWFLPLYVVGDLKRVRRSATVARSRTATPGLGWRVPLQRATALRWKFSRRADSSRAIPTRARRQSKFDQVLAAAGRLHGRADAAQWVRRLRHAALMEEDDKALKGALATIGSFL
jgi:hypothetical protein